MKKMIQKNILTALFAFSAMASIAQGIRHYNFSTLPYLNAAYTGRNEDVEGVLLYQQQHVKIDGTPRQILGFVDGRVGASPINLGGGVHYQSIGVQKQIEGIFNVGYTVKLKKQRRLSFGLQGVIGYRQEKGSELSTTLPGDDIYKQNTTSWGGNAGIGIAYQSKNFHLGFSVPQLLNNDFLYQTGKNKVRLGSFNFNITSAYNLSIGRGFEFIPSVMLRSDKIQRFNADINLLFKYKEYVWFGPYYRANAAFGMMLGLGITKYLRLSYAGEVQQTAARNSYFGSHEVVLGFRIPKKGSGISRSPRYF